MISDSDSDSHLEAKSLVEIPSDSVADLDWRYLGLL